MDINYYIHTTVSWNNLKIKLNRSIKFFLSIIFLSIISFSSYSQQSSEVHKTTDGLTMFSLEDSIVKFKGLLSCADNNQSTEVVNLEGKLSCIGFKYLLEEDDYVTIGNLKFKNTYLFIDSLKKIFGISYIKIYLEKDIPNAQKQSKDDYVNLKIFLTNLLKVKGKKYKNKIDKNSGLSKGLVWNEGNTKYLLRKFNFENRHKNVVGQLILELSKVE